MCRCRPTLPLTFLSDYLAFDSVDEARDFLVQAGAAVDDDKQVVNTTASKVEAFQKPKMYDEDDSEEEEGAGAVPLLKARPQ